MEKDLIKFYDNIEIINKDLSKYEDNKGNMFILNTINLLARVDYMELTKEEYKVAKFQQKIEDLDYSTTKIKRVVSKNEITKKDEDKYTLVDKEVSVRQIWNVSNPYGVFKSYTDKDEAVKYAREVNEKILEYYK